MRRLGCVIACCLVAGPAYAQPAQQAKEHFKRGAAADKEHRWADAIKEYERAYSIAPHPDVLFNIAVDEEHLEHWTKAADLFQRYLDERDAPAPDAAAVAERIRDLRAKAEAAAPPPPPHHDEPPPHEPPPREPPTVDVTPQPPLGAQDPGPPPQAETPPSVSAGPKVTFTRYHVAGSYGFADGGELSERYQLRAGATFARHVDLDGVLGQFGNNDYAAGAMLRLILAPASSHIQPFALGAATIGMARQDGSSRAGRRFPIGFEAGGGLQFGAHGRFEIAAVLRYLVGGWGSDETTAFSYANDAVAFAIDLGGAFDVPVISGAH